MSLYAITNQAEIRHEILDTQTGGAGIFDEKYTGQYHGGG
jgi:hypothetical protein